MSNTESDVEVKFGADTGDFDARVKSLNETLKGVGETAGELKSPLAEGAAGMDKMKLATAGMTREMIVLGHEVVSGNFSRIPGSLVVLAERMGGLNLATVGLGAVVGGVTYALIELAIHAEQSAESINHIAIAMEAQGRAALNGAALEQYTDQLKKLPGINSEAARSIETELATAANISSESFTKLIGIVADYASVVGEKAPKAAEEFVKMSEDPLRAAEKLAQTYQGILVPAQYDQIETLTLMGEKQQAMDVLTNALTERFAGLQERGLTPAQTGANMFANALTWVGQKLGETLDFVTPLEKALGELAIAFNGGSQAAQSAGNPAQMQNQMNDAIIRGMNLQREYSGVLEQRKKLLADIETETAAIGAAEVEAANSGSATDRQRVASLEATRAEMQSRMNNLRDQDVQKEATTISAKRSLNEQYYTQMEEKIRTTAALGQITSKQEFSQLESQKQSEWELNERTFDQQLALYNKDSTEYAKLLGQKNVANMKYQNDVLRLQKEEADQQQQIVKRAENERIRSFQSSVGSMQSTFNNNVAQMTIGTQTLSQGFRNMAASLVTGMISALLRIGEQWVATQLLMLITGKPTSDAIIAGHAGEAYAAAFASTAAIPIIGPALAPGVAAASGAAAEAGGLALASFDVGTNFVPHDMIAQVHEGERIIPRADNEALMNSFGGSQTHVHFHTSAIDGAGVDKFFKQHGKKVAKTLTSSIRRGGSGLGRRL